MVPSLRKFTHISSYIPQTISIIATIAMIGTYWSFEEKSKSNEKSVTALYSYFTGPTTLKQWLNSRKWWWQRGQWGRKERALEFQVGRETLPLGPGLSNEPQHQHQPPDDHQHDDQHQHQAELMSMSMCHLQILPTRICLKLLVWNRLAQLLVSIYLLYWHWSGVFRLWANEAFHRILIGDGRPWARNEHQWHFGEKCNYKFLNTTNRPRFCTNLIQSNLVIKQSRSNLVEMLDKSETVRSLSVDCPTILYFFARSLLLPLSHMPHCCYHWKWIFGR